MPDRKRRLKILMLHMILLPTLIYTLYFFSLAPKSWTGVDEEVVGKIAKEHGREAKKPLINTDQGDLLLFVFLLAGVVSGFVAGYYWRTLVGENKKVPKGKDRGQLMEYEEIVAFHGHKCPGLAIGYRMALAAMATLGVVRSYDEELVAIVENDACGVDALQMLTGCTFGKGNLIFRDYGKPVFTVYSRTSGKGVRVLFRDAAVPPELAGDREGRINFLLAAADEEILEISSVPFAEPKRARIFQTVSCEQCGESVMETRLRDVHGKNVCIPCAEAKSGQAS